ncbi:MULTISPECIES: LysE family transporter [Streptomyces]|uniref:LysE family transporter n=1 Tax=Streptomyces TaxID=1883 RepID=UPI00131E2805|nr:MULTISPECIES: LysE family transporter [unclassified Streptomyces]MBT3079118.1 LysE family transporter [Streptomyces sp. COG20]MBT3109059.1 LysE family transporter [Streptomyces sp. CYG20]MDI7788326.1 LysE family transporter [Streptomyces cavourensis]
MVVCTGFSDLPGPRSRPPRGGGSRSRPRRGRRGRRSGGGRPEQAAPQPPAAGEPPADRLPRHLLLGFLCTAGNPKVGLFLTVFLPQFLPVEAPSAAALSLLALVYLAIGALWLLVLTEVGVRVVARRTAGEAAFPPLAARIGNAVAGLVLLGLALTLFIR